MKRLALLLTLGALGCATVERAAQDEASPGTWRKVDASTSRLTELASIGELAGQFPDSGTVQVRYLLALIDAGRLDEARRLLDTIVARGYRFSAAGGARINAALAVDGQTTARALTLGPGDRVEASEPLASVPDTIQLVESVLRERTSGRLYVSAVVSRGLFRQDGNGGWERVPLGTVGSIGGLAQAADGTIWMASAAYDPTPDAVTAFRGLIGYDPRTGAVTRITAPAGVEPSDIAIGRDGTLFGADPLSGAIYRAKRGADGLEALVGPGTFRSAQGMAVSVDGRKLYVSDYGYGLAVIDLVSRRVDRVAAPGSPFVDGTDGLWLHGNALIAIQNGTRPLRIVRHTLAKDGRSIASSRVIEAAHSGWTEPGSGTIDGDNLLYVATAQWDRFGEGGAAIEGKPPMPTELRALPVAGKPQSTAKKRR